MSNVLLIIQLIISIILTGLILIQRSEGGALGIGGGGGGGGLMSGRSAATSVARMTAIVGAAFLVNSMLLAVVFNLESDEASIIDDSVAVEALTIEGDSAETITPSINVSPETDVTVDAPAEVEVPTVNEVRPSDISALDEDGTESETPKAE